MTRAMKDSGIEWIGQIPKNWEIVKVKHLFHIGRGRVIAKTELLDEQHQNKGYPVYSSQTKNNGILGYISTYDFDIPQITWTTDGANAGTVFLRDGYYNCTNVCGTLTLKDQRLSLNYLLHILSVVTPHYKRKDTNGYKIMNNEMAEIQILYPPLKEQEWIAHILDEKVMRIDAIIADTKQSIEELKQYKQSLITETVTKGLDKNVPMKDSGIEWIGQIPENWGLKRIGFFFNKVKTPNKNLIEKNLLSLSYGNIIQKNINTNEGLLPKSFETYNIVLPGDIVLRMTDLQNDHKSLRTGFVGEKGIITSAYITLRIKNSNKINSKYIQQLLHAFDIKKGFYSMGSGVRQGVTFSDIKKIDIVVPSLAEQKEIIEFLDNQTKKIDQLIQDKEVLITQYEEYKKSIIYEYVTGKREI